MILDSPLGDGEGGGGAGTFTEEQEGADFMAALGDLGDG